MLNTLLRYPWPGNVRELENAIERAVVLQPRRGFHRGPAAAEVRMFAQQRAADSSRRIDRDPRLPPRRAGDRASTSMREGEIYELVIDEVERRLIREALDRNGGVKTRTADFLGINRNTLNKKVKELGIEAGE